MKLMLCSCVAVLLGISPIPAVASEQLALSLRQRTEKGEVVLDILVSNVSRTSLDVTSKGIIPPWSVWAWFDWTVDGKPAKYWENVALLTDTKESWRIPPLGVILWASVPLRKLEIKTRDGYKNAIADKKRYVVTILPTRRWDKLKVAPGRIEIEQKNAEPSPEGVGGRTEEPKDAVRATLEVNPDKPRWFVMHVTNVSAKTVRFLDIREGDAGCGDFYEITVEKDGKTYESKGRCWYAPGSGIGIVELAPGQTYNRDIQPGAYLQFGKSLIPPCEISVTYRLTEKIKEKWKGRADKVDLDLTFQTTKVKMETLNKELKATGEPAP